MEGAVPVQTSPEGQQAGEFAESRAQDWPLAQQIPSNAEPWSAQLKVPEIQPLLVALAKRAATTAAAAAAPPSGAAAAW